MFSSQMQSRGLSCTSVNQKSGLAFVPIRMILTMGCAPSESFGCRSLHWSMCTRTWYSPASHGSSSPMPQQILRRRLPAAHAGAGGQQQMRRAQGPHACGVASCRMNARRTGNDNEVHTAVNLRRNTLGSLARWQLVPSRLNNISFTTRKAALPPTRTRILRTWGPPPVGEGGYQGYCLMHSTQKTKILLRRPLIQKPVY